MARELSQFYGEFLEKFNGSMVETVVRVVDVYAYRLEEEQPQFLLLRRAPGVSYAGQWRMIGGKIRPGEAAWQTALREIEEETGQQPRRLWVVSSLNAFYEWQHDRINLIPAFAAELIGDPVLNDEHDAFVWLDEEEAASRLPWPEQQRLLRLTAQLLRQGLPPEILVFEYENV
jgi:dATP pyrophosphohydrolase